MYPPTMGCPVQQQPRDSNPLKSTQSTGEPETETENDSHSRPAKRQKCEPPTTVAAAAATHRPAWLFATEHLSAAVFTVCLEWLGTRDLVAVACCSRALAAHLGQQPVVRQILCTQLEAVLRGTRWLMAPTRCPVCRCLCRTVTGHSRSTPSAAVARAATRQPPFCCVSPLWSVTARLTRPSTPAAVGIERLVGDAMQAIEFVEAIVAVAKTGGASSTLMSGSSSSSGQSGQSSQSSSCGQSGQSSIKGNNNSSTQAKAIAHQATMTMPAAWTLRRTRRLFDLAVSTLAQVLQAISVNPSILVAPLPVLQALWQLQLRPLRSIGSLVMAAPGDRVSRPPPPSRLSATTATTSSTALTGCAQTELGGTFSHDALLALAEVLGGGECTSMDRLMVSRNVHVLWLGRPTEVVDVEDALMRGVPLVCTDIRFPWGHLVRAAARGLRALQLFRCDWEDTLAAGSAGIAAVLDAVGRNPGLRTLTLPSTGSTQMQTALFRWLQTCGDQRPSMDVSWATHAASASFADYVLIWLTNDSLAYVEPVASFSSDELRHLVAVLRTYARRHPRFEHRRYAAQMLLDAETEPPSEGLRAYIALANEWLASL